MNVHDVDGAQAPEMVRIPGGRKGVESLNAAVAASIAMSEIFRK